jgi:hypothetical protein
MYVCVFSVFLLSCSATGLQEADPQPKELYKMSINGIPKPGKWEALDHESVVSYKKEKINSLLHVKVAYVQFLTNKLQIFCTIFEIG